MFQVRTVGNAVPRGTVKIIVECADGTRKSKTRNYPGSSSVTFRGLPSGKCTVTYKFIPKKGSAFLRSDLTRSFKVD